MKKTHSMYFFIFAIKPDNVDDRFLVTGSGNESHTLTHQLKP